MKQSEAKRTIVMLATQLAAAKHRARVASLDLKLMVETVKELSAASRDKELELQEYRREEAARTSTPAQEPSTAPSAMSFGQAIELMARRPGLELVDNEGDRWRVTADGSLQCSLEVIAGEGVTWGAVPIRNDWNLLTFSMPLLQSALTAS